MPGGVLLLHGQNRTTIGDEMFHVPVRNGKVWFHFSMTTGQTVTRNDKNTVADKKTNNEYNQLIKRPRLLKNAHEYGIKPHGQLVSVSLTRYRASTSDLSTL